MDNYRREPNPRLWMKRNSFPRRLAVILLTTAALFSLVATQHLFAAQPRFERDVILVSDTPVAGTLVPYWVSWDLLSAADPHTQGDVQLDPAIIKSIHEYVVTRTRQRNLCRGPLSPAVAPTPETAIPLLTMFSGDGVAVLGRVERTDVGWAMAPSRVETLVYATVEEVFRDDTGRLQPGEQFTFLDGFGTISLSRGVLCTEKVKGTYIPKVGEVFALLASHRDASEGVPHLVTCSACTFAIQATPEGLVIAPNPAPEFEQEALAVEVLRQRLEELGGPVP